MTAFAMAVAAAAVGAGAPFWTGEATIAGASIIGGMGVPALGVRHYVLIRNIPMAAWKYLSKGPKAVSLNQITTFCRNLIWACALQRRSGMNLLSPSADLLTAAKPMVQMQSYAKLCVARRQACDQLWDPGASNAAGCCHVGMKGGLTMQDCVRISVNLRHTCDQPWGRCGL